MVGLRSVLMGLSLQRCFPQVHLLHRQHLSLRCFFHYYFSDITLSTICFMSSYES